MKFGDLYNKRLNLRISDRTYDYLERLAKDRDMNVSEFIRNIIDVYVCNNMLKEIQEYENIKANSNN